MLAHHLFHQQAKHFLEYLIHHVASLFDYDETEDSLTLYLPDQRVYLFNIHNALHQLWMASPISGGRHFYYKISSTSCWVDTRNGEHLLSVLDEEFKKACGFSLLAAKADF